MIDHTVNIECNAATWTMTAVAGITACVVIAGCQRPAPAVQAPRVEFLQMPGSQEANLPFSAAVRVGDMLYLSGVIGTDPEKLQPIAGGIQAETRRAMEIIKQRVEAFGSSMDRIVKCTVFLADVAEWPAMNQVYVTFFDTPPARSALGANGLALGARVEIECIAVVNSAAP